MPGSTGDSGPLNPTIGKYLEGGGAPRPKPPVDSRPVAVISQIVEGMLIYRVQPVYPQTAIITRVQGSVTLRAIIGRDGTIQHLRAESGPPMLVPAALDAVRQWRYRPFYLNGQAVEVETQVTVNFVLTK